MKAITPLLRPRALLKQPHTRCLSTLSPETIETIRARMLSQPPTLIDDYLTPTPSHLLSLSLYSAADPPATTPPPPFAAALLGHPLPPAAHLVHFPLRAPPHTLCRDGTDAAHLPHAALPKRMWEGGSVAYARGWADALVVDGRRALCCERVVDVRPARHPGHVLVDLCRSYAAASAAAAAARGSGGETAERVVADAAVTERRTLVFMPEDAPVGGPRDRVVRCPYKPHISRAFTPSDLMLFNFSALTYNAHKIHYTSGYDGFNRPLVHGPLTQALLLHVLSTEMPTVEVQTMEYSNLAPLFANEQLTVCLAAPRDGRVRVWISGPDGGMAVKGSAVVIQKQVALNI